MIPHFTYLPQDRLHALARGEPLPDRTTGSALFADISGFTPLTEVLKKSLGPRRGAEELTHKINAVYSALIAEVEKYGGSVIGFAGDSFICWFDKAQGPAAARAATCAFELQIAMRQFEAIRLPDGTKVAVALKVTVATGPARRFVVGDPDVLYLDVLAGATVTRTATAEHLAKKGEILVDESTIQTLDTYLTIQEWRMDHESLERFAVITNIADLVTMATQTERTLDIDSAILQAWLHPAVYERELGAQGVFLTEFRPAVALFVRFIGIDYDADEAQIQLDAFIRQAQGIIARYEGTLIQLTIGDKGSYLSINFGALSAHEDDARRAVKTARELRMMVASLGFLAPLQAGIAQGIMRIGAYGGLTRRTYGTMGDDVNLAARLMQTASPGEILLSGSVHNSTADDFVFEPRPPLAMKGKTEPLSVFAVTDKRNQRAIRLQEPRYALPMVGRQHELHIIEEKLDLAFHSKCQVIGIMAEAGLGKSRLVAEVIRVARSKGFIGYGGACRSDAINTPYQAWKSISSAFFDVDPDAKIHRQIRWLEGEIEDRAPSRVDAMPLLNSVLDLNIPDNAFTQTLEPKTRRSTLHALLEDCLKAAAKEEPLLIVIEDLHWIDALSHDLLDELARAMVAFRICFVLAYRPTQIQRLQTPRLEALPQFTKIELSELNTAEAEQAIRAKLAQLYPARGGALPERLVDALMARAQGNPFYLEELLNFVRDRGLDPEEIENIELPDSLHTLILSRIDHLSEGEKITLRVASIVGRLFRAKWLTGYYPELGSSPQVKARLEALDITPLDSPEPELAYLFKHIVTHEVTYESLPFSTRARLHEQLARYLEVSAAEIAPLLNTLAFHYGRSENTEKQREYYRKAGEAAQKNFASDAALDFYNRLLPLLTDAGEQIAIHMRRGAVLELMGKWDEAEVDYQVALESGKNDMALKASAQFALGKLNRLRGDYEPALDWLAQAKTAHTALGDIEALAQVLIETGMVLYRKGEYAQAREPLNEGLALARDAGDKLGTALALNNLGNINTIQGDNNAAEALYENSLAQRREMGDKAGMASSLGNLGVVARIKGDYPAARKLHEESLALYREIGGKRGIANSLNNLGILTESQGDYPAAQALYEESLMLQREMGDKYGIVSSLINLGNVAVVHGDYHTAQSLYEEILLLRREMGDKYGVVGALNNLGLVAYLQGNNTTSRALLKESMALCKKMDDKPSMAYALLGLGLVGLAENKGEARGYILESVRLRQETGEKLQLTSSLIGMAGLALQAGDGHCSAQLLGAADTAIKTLNATMEIEICNFQAQTLATTCETLGEAAFQSAWEEGAKWSLEEAITYALEAESA